MGNKPLFIDHLDTPNIDNRAKMPKTERTATLVIVLGSVLSTLLFLALLLIYRQLAEQCLSGQDTIPCAAQQLLLYSPVLFLVALFVVIIIGGYSYAKTLGWFNYFEKNAHITDERISQKLQEERLRMNSDMAKIIAESLRSAGWQTVSDDHSNTYKQTVPPEAEINLTEDKNVMDESKLSPIEWLDKDN